MMRAFASLIAAVLFGLAAVSPAYAHRLRVFATVEQGEIAGYAYFVGGARAKGANVMFRDSGDREVHRMNADGSGAFRWRPEAPQTVKIVVDAGEGHVATLLIDRSRFSGRSAAIAADDARAEEEGLTPVHREMVETAVDAAMERHARVMLEKFEAMETRLRINDIIGGIGMIVGVAGAALWALSRRKGGAA